MTKSTSGKSSTRTRTRRAKAGKASAPKREPPNGPSKILAFADSYDGDIDVAANEVEVARQMETWVMFALAEESFAFPVGFVKEILRVSTITRVPHAPYPVSGIINMRGRVVPVVDLRLRIGLPETEIDRQSRILVASSHGRLLGLLVDAVHQVVHLDLNAVAAPPDDVMTEQSEYITGVYRLPKTLLILLDVEKVLTIPAALQRA